MTCECVWLGAGGVGGDRIGFGLYQYCILVVVVLGESGWAAWTRVLEGGVMSVCVVSLDSLCRWQVQVSVYCARRIPVHLRCTPVFKSRCTLSISGS